MNHADYFSNDSIRDDLRGKTVRGGLWTGIAQGVGILISFGAVPVLARLLDPADFGLVAMVAVFTNFGRMFVDAGLSMATVQREEINHQQVTNLFWLALGLALLISGIVAVLSPGIAWFYGDQRLVAIVLAMTTSYVMAGLTIQHQALLRRKMQFRALAMVQISSVLVAQCVGVGWAWRNYGQVYDFWALVFIPLASAAVTMIGCWVACPWRPGTPKRGSGVRQMVAFGANLTGANLLNYLIRNLDKMLLGWSSGAVILGYYERAYRLLLFPLQNFNAPITSVIVPALSRMAHARQRLTEHYLKVLRLLLTFQIPLLVSVLITAEWWVLLALGSQWEESIPAFRWLSIVGILQPITNSTGWLFIVQGKTRGTLHMTMIVAPLTLLGFAMGLPWGHVGVACGYATVTLLFTMPTILYFLKKYDVIAPSCILTELVRVVPLVLAVATANLALVLSAPDMKPALGAVCSVTISLLTIVAIVFRTRQGRGILEDLRWIVGSKEGAT